MVRCKIHALPTDVDQRKPSCQKEGCQKNRLLFRGSKFCEDHTDAEMKRKMASDKHPLRRTGFKRRLPSPSRKEETADAHSSDIDESLWRS